MTTIYCGATCKSVTWFNTSYGHAQANQDWLKMRLMTGVTTSIGSYERIAFSSSRAATTWLCLSFLITIRST
jgi:hypothetical protein